MWHVGWPIRLDPIMDQGRQDDACAANRDCLKSKAVGDWIHARALESSRSEVGKRDLSDDGKRAI